MIAAGSKRVRIGSVSHKLCTRTKMYRFRPICQSGQFANCAAKSADLQKLRYKICRLANWPDWQIGRNMYIVFPLISREYWLKEGTQTKASHCLNFTGSNPDLHSQSNTQIGGISGYNIIIRQKHIVYEV